MDKFLKRLAQPSSYAGFAALAIAVPQILGIGAEKGEAVSAGAQAAGQAAAQGLPIWQSILVGVLGGAAVLQNDKSNE